MKTILNLIGGEMKPPASGAYFDCIEPATGKAYARVPDSDARDLEDAVAAAKAAFPAWRDTPPQDRAALMNNLADLVERRTDNQIEEDERGIEIPRLPAGERRACRSESRAQRTGEHRPEPAEHNESADQNRFIVPVRPIDHEWEKRNGGPKAAVAGRTSGGAGPI